MANALLNNTLRSCKILDKFYGCLRRNYLLINTHCNQDLSYPDKEVDGWKYTVELTNHKEQPLQFCLFLKRKFLVSFKSKSANLEFEEVLSCRVVKFNYVTLTLRRNMSVHCTFPHKNTIKMKASNWSLLVLKSPNRYIIPNNHRDRRTVTWIYTFDKQATSARQAALVSIPKHIATLRNHSQNQSPSMYVLLETIKILVIHFL